MKTWLKTIAEELQGLSSDDLLISPDSEVSEKEEVIGEIDSDELKSIYCLVQKWGKAARFAAESGKAEKASELAEKADLLMAIFWASLKDAFDLWEKPAVGIRKDWKVVWFKRKASSPNILGIHIVSMGSPHGDGDTDCEDCPAYGSTCKGK